MNKRKATPKATGTFFINPAVAASYTTIHPNQADSTLIIPKLKWHGPLSRITPKVAQHLAQQGHLIVPKK